MCKTCVNSRIWIGIKIERRIRIIHMMPIHNNDFFTVLIPVVSTVLNLTVVCKHSFVYVSHLIDFWEMSEFERRELPWQLDPLPTCCPYCRKSEVTLWLFIPLLRMPMFNFPRKWNPEGIDKHNPIQTSLFEKCKRSSCLLNIEWSPPAPPTLSSSYFYYWHEANFVIGTCPCPDLDVNMTPWSYSSSPPSTHPAYCNASLHTSLGQPSSKCGTLTRLVYVNFLFAEIRFFTCHRAYYKFNICAIDYILLYSCGRKIRTAVLYIFWVAYVSILLVVPQIGPHFVPLPTVYRPKVSIYVHL